MLANIFIMVTLKNGHALVAWTCSLIYYLLYLKEQEKKQTQCKYCKAYLARDSCSDCQSVFAHNKDICKTCLNYNKFNFY